jgi:5-hydroxyisourate hydrolase-like protein (transthyretin family)
MKMCRRCNSPKDESEFNTYKKYGKTYLKSMCKPCQSDWYAEKGYGKKSYDKNKEHKKQLMKEYAQTEEGRAAKLRAQKKYRSSEQYSLKQNARKKVLRAVQAGKLTKPKLCESCKQELKLEAHHEDYNVPLEVVWLCKDCHEDTHHLNEGHESV